MAHAKNLGEPFMAHLENLYNIPWLHNQQMLSLFLRQKYFFPIKMLAICTPMNQIALSPNFLESAYSRSMSTTKIILIISSSTKILYLEDILLKCLPKNKTLIF